METSSESTSFLDPNFALYLYGKFGKIGESVRQIKLIIEEFRERNETNRSTPSPSALKNNFRSNELREEAERCSDNKDESTLLHRLELYNESLCYADGDQLAVLYAGRAAVYFDLKQYEICSENVRLAEVSGCAVDLLVELNELKVGCLQRSQKNSNHRKKKKKQTEIKLNVEPHLQIPFAAGCLELKTDRIRGRYITTNEDIKPGSIVVVESPFEKVLSVDCIYQRCSNCFDKHLLNLIPCPNCTKAMFCSDKCMREAFERFHRFECPIIDCLYDVGGQISLRTFLKAFQSFDSMNELIEFTQSSDTHNLTAFSFDHSAELSPQQHYHQIHSLATNRDIRPELDLFTHVMVAALFYYQLSCHTPFKDLVNDECSDSLIELMFHIELITTINSFNFNDLSSLQENCIIGTGLYGFSSLINHSCSPNACATFCNSQLILYTTQPIKQGDPLSISYK